MNTTELKRIVQKIPFEPFTVCLMNGAQYTFAEQRDFGAPRNLRVIFHFGKSGWTMIDTGQITEVVTE